MRLNQQIEVRLESGRLITLPAGLPLGINPDGSPRPSLAEVVAKRHKKENQKEG